MAEIEAVKDGAITRVLINRVDQMNSITPDMHRSLQGVFDDFATDDSQYIACLLYTSPSPRDRQKSRMPSSA